MDDSEKNLIGETEEEIDEQEEVEIDELTTTFESVDVLEKSSQVTAYQEILLHERTDEFAVKIKEQCIYKITAIHAEMNNFEKIIELLNSSNAYFSVIPKARTAKIVRTIIDIVAKVPDSLDVQIKLCQNVIEWCKVEKRTFLRQRVEGKLAALLLQKNSLQEAYLLIVSLLKELKKLDDKQLLTEAHLTESRIYHALQNIPKAKASLTACRTTANSIYVTPLLQAELDEMSGILLCEDHDNVTSYSYFLEAFEAFDHAADKRAITCLKYMCLCKVLNNESGEIPNIITNKTNSKTLTKHADIAALEIAAMESIAKAAKGKSLELFTKAVNEYTEQLRNDPLISHHLDVLYDKMLETNLMKIILPYSCVEVDRVADLINLPLDQVERKLSQMILDGQFSGILDQGRGQLIIFDEAISDKSFKSGIEIIANLGLVVEALSKRAKGLTKTVQSL